MGYLSSYRIGGNDLQFPVYLPDATRAVVRSLDVRDLRSVGIEALVVNTYHLMQSPGAEFLRRAGGVKRFMHWDGPVVADSGGFQILSLIYERKITGAVDADGMVWYEGERKRRRHTFTPEDSVRAQFAIGSDIVICLDDCMHGEGDREFYRRGVERTIEWAKRSKEEFEKQVAQRRMPRSERPLLLAVNQGGLYADLREQCGRELADVGFDAYGWGGWSLDPKTGKLDMEIAKVIAETMPAGLPKFALGVGTPQDIALSFLLGYHLFDCVLPTRDARHARLYVLPKPVRDVDFAAGEKVFDYVHLDRNVYADDFSPVSDSCDCPACANYSRAYIHHLFAVKDTLAHRLATMHNLRTYTRLIGQLRELREP